jgi:hypothetical protein
MAARHDAGATESAVSAIAHAVLNECTFPRKPGALSLQSDCPRT